MLVFNTSISNTESQKIYKHSLKSNYFASKTPYPIHLIQQSTIPKECQLEQWFNLEHIRHIYLFTQNVDCVLWWPWHRSHQQQPQYILISAAVAANIIAFFIHSLREYISNNILSVETCACGYHHERKGNCFNQCIWTFNIIWRLAAVDSHFAGKFSYVSSVLPQKSLHLKNLVPQSSSTTNLVPQ